MFINYLLELHDIMPWGLFQMQKIDFDRNNFFQFGVAIAFAKYNHNYRII
jgi:hypothetical protein